ncbi:hypothetical protein ALNOE001_00280 [Candidatus Methanobinarius endosymbioticus]|uniref:UPF0305 protein ALNOE001_00280 n=1 Tax=Candidatus Methanobinarius endosymbioticus TaxID=2006182 RepID=A0A366MEB4_9EURY|nr:hypothetical protein ALNOE001_00280 [Candidatus Methanobinarius endosymbioticus]
MYKELDCLKSEKKILKKDLMKTLQNLAKNISVHDLMIATVILREEGKYIQTKYREEYLETYIKYFIMRIKNIREDKKEYKDEICNKEDFSEAINLLKSQFDNNEEYKNENNKFPLIYTIICLYSTFILNKSIHPVGTPFPGNLKVTYENEIYLCPVKDKQKENQQAVCTFCIAKQTDLN